MLFFPDFFCFSFFLRAVVVGTGREALSRRRGTGGYPPMESADTVAFAPARGGEGRAARRTADSEGR